MDRWREYPVLRATLVALVAGFCLIGAGLAGSRASVVLVAALLVLAGVTRVAVSAAERRGLDRIDAHRYAADLPFAPALAAFVAALFLGASPGEVQALGGAVGLLGMLNYFLRPAYYVAFRAATRVARI